MAHNLASLLRLMLVTDDGLVAGRDLIPLAQAAERGGVTAVQLRLKRASPRDLVDLARRLAHGVRVPVLVNDRLDVALAAGAAGVHLGPEDLSVALARRITPPGFIIGASVGTSDEAATARSADYWGVGPWRASDTKADAGEPLGAEGLRRIVALAGATPCVAIGGVRPEDVGRVRAAGGAGVAVVSGILGGPDVEERAKRYKWESAG
ncbi:MAG TPA: thiamine phosphate synthase [Gemmatimonadales bacterium]|nr:thiamine phosphate synthase [Gemmatimonadales bacterium]